MVYKGTVNHCITFLKNERALFSWKKGKKTKKITYRGCPVTSVIVSMFGPHVVRSRLDAVSHHSTEKDVKRHEFFEKKKKKKS